MVALPHRQQEDNERKERVTENADSSVLGRFYFKHHKMDKDFRGNETKKGSMHHHEGLIGRAEAQGHRDLGATLSAVLKRATTTRGGGLHHTLPSLFSHRQSPTLKPYQTPTKLLTTTTTTTSFMQKCPATTNSSPPSTSSDSYSQPPLATHQL